MAAPLGRRDPGIVGQALTLDGKPATVVGVMPARFEFPVGRDLWVPRVYEGWEARNRSSRFWHVAGKLKPGVDIAAGRAELDAIATQIAAENPRNEGVGVAVVPLAEHLAGRARTTLLLFLGAVGLVLLIACVNVANLLLVRAAKRQHEFAIRAAIGADRRRILKQTITESLLLGALGGACGLLLAAWGLAVFEPIQPASIPHALAPGLDARALSFASLLAIGSTLLFGLVPALQVARTAALRQQLHGGASAAPAARRFRKALVVSELALSMVLLVSAALLLRSFAALLDVDRGYRTDNVLALTVQAWNYYPEPAQRRLFVEQALERIDELPGVAATGVTSSLPLAEGIGTDTAELTIVGRPEASADGPLGAHAVIATAGYFRVLGIPLRAGRVFEPTDTADTPRVVVVNEAMARRHWPGEDPVGARIRLWFGGPPTDAEVIGVVGDVRDALQADPQPSLFVAYAQQPTGALHFTVRADGDPGTLVRAVQDEIWAMNPAMPFAEVTTLEGLFDDSLRDRRSMLLLVIAFSVTALALAAIGAYGLVSHESNRRSHEIGIRVAIGASRRRVLALVVGDGLKLALLGIGVGAVLAVAAGRALQGFLFGVGAFDPITLAAIALVMLAVTTLASLLPAWRAARADPIAALRPNA
jgi:putative ABC transport system permease protein